MRGTTSTSSRWPSSTQASARSSERARSSTWPGSTPRSRTSTPHSDGRWVSALRSPPSPVRDAWWYWLMRDRYAEALGWIDRALSPPGADAHPALRVRVLCIRGGTLWPLGRKREQPAVAQQAEAIARTLADPILLCEVLYTRARYEGPAVPISLGRSPTRHFYLAREADDDWAAGMAASTRTIAADTAAELRERVELAAGLLERVGNVYELAYLLANASYTALQMGSDRDASDFVRRATPVTRELDSPYLEGHAGLTALVTGDADSARCVPGGAPALPRTRHLAIHVGRRWRTRGGGCTR